MTPVKTRWLETVRRKNSQLCVGIDPAEKGQRPGAVLANAEEKLAFCLDLVAKVAPFASAIKPNRNYFKDFSRAQMVALNQKIHECDMLSIDDSKLADIGETNDAGLFHAASEGFDLVTYAPFAGNIKDASRKAVSRGLGLITLVLMSNPEFQVIKEATIGGMKGFEYFASEAARWDSPGIVIGAPSPDNHITVGEIERVREIVGERLVLVPGIGAQGGACDVILACFGEMAMINVGRAIMHAPDPAGEALACRDRIRALRTGQ